MNENLRFAWFEDQLISLNLFDDTYTIFSAEQSRKIRLRAMNRPRSVAPDSISATIPGASAVLAIIDQTERNYRGVSQNCWQLTSHDVCISAGVMAVARSWMALRAVHRRSAAERLAGLKRLIEQEREHRALTPRRDIDDLVRSLNAACLLYHRRTKCLEWAGALLLVGFQYGFDLRLVVGVQNRPFYAHAWVEHEGRIVGDEPGLRNQLAVILEIN